MTKNFAEVWLWDGELCGKCLEMCVFVPSQLVPGQKTSGFETEVGWGGVMPTQPVATLLDLHWYFYMNLMLWYLIFTCTSAWTWCYAIWFSIIFRHELDVMRLYLELGARRVYPHGYFYINSMLRYLTCFNLGGVGEKGSLLWFCDLDFLFLMVC